MLTDNYLLQFISDREALFDLVESHSQEPIWLHHHPLGFLRLLLTSEDRLTPGWYLHLWPDSHIDSQSDDFKIHSHIFELESYVLFGSVRNAFYEARPTLSGRFAEVVALHGPHGAEMRPTGVYFSIESERHITVNATESYGIARGQFHATLSTGRPTATLMRKTNVARDLHPRHLVSVTRLNSVPRRREALSHGIVTSTVGGDDEEAVDGVVLRC